MNTELERARELIAGAARIVVLTGAGVSAESGVPTFRGAGGLWKEHRPEDLATPQAFARDPRLVWEWYGWRRELVAACRPNEAHLALAKLALTRDGVRIVTQNVDELHADAAHTVSSDLGVNAAPAMPLELHGSIFRVSCTACGATCPHRDPIDASSQRTLPTCTACKGLLRPGVVWFGESLDERVISEAFELASSADVCLVIGTSAVVHPAASLAVTTARRGGSVIEVNPDPTPLTPLATISIRGRAAEIVPSCVLT